jgi:AmmeMemoRadiSam system protein A
MRKSGKKEMLPLSEADQKTLLRMAREALVAYLESAEIPTVPTEPAETLRQHCGAFVTLRKGRNLRGCIGVVTANNPLYVTVSECAVWAAVQDPRFPPVTKRELPELTMEVSVLSPLFEIAPQDIEVGRHGLLISHEGWRGLLLPQVAVEWKWNREQFLEETCRKAGLPSDAWRHGAKIQAFTAQVFEEPHTAGATSESPRAT